MYGYFYVSALIAVGQSHKWPIFSAQIQALRFPEQYLLTSGMPVMYLLNAARFVTLTLLVGAAVGCGGNQSSTSYPTGHSYTSPGYPATNNDAVMDMVRSSERQLIDATRAYEQSLTQPEKWNNQPRPSTSFSNNFPTTNPAWEIRNNLQKEHYDFLYRKSANSALNDAYSTEIEAESYLD